VVVVGVPDVGKSTFCAYLVNRFQQTRLRTAVVDADIGQSSIGPPTVIGLGFVNQDVTHLSEVPMAAGYFVGSISPSGHLLPCVVGTRRMVERAFAMQAEAVVVDTSGLAVGGAGRELKVRKLELLTPSDVVLLERDGELAYLRRAWQSITGPRFHVIRPAPQARQRPREERQAFRSRRFAAYFAEMRELRIKLDQVALRGLWLGSGRPLDAEAIVALGHQLGVVVYHAEQIDDHLFVLTNNRPLYDAVTAVEQALQLALHVNAIGQFTNLLLGLHNQRGHFIGLGIWRRLDFDRGWLRLLVPPLHGERVHLIVAGSLRVRSDGTELGSFRSGSIR